MLECRFQRDVASLDALFAFVERYLATHEIDPAQGFEVNLLIEELFTNMVKYGGGRQDISVGLGHADGVLTIMLRDYDVERWDVTQSPAVDTTRPVVERRAGGLGLHLVGRIADSFSYTYQDRNSTVTVTKRLAS
jgi:anti-sigma regulatory factor (Ser/Thr protein kinase)